MKVQDIGIMIVFGVVLLATAGPAQTSIEQLIPVQHKKEFTAYYQKLIASQKKQRLERRKRFVHNLAQEGKAALYVRKDSSMNRQLQDITLWPKHEQTKLYVRFGAYERFLKEQASQKATAWYKIRYYAESAKRSLSTLFHKFMPGTLVAA